MEILSFYLHSSGCQSRSIELNSSSIIQYRRIWELENLLIAKLKIDIRVNLFQTVIISVNK